MVLPLAVVVVVFVVVDAAVYMNLHRGTKTDVLPDAVIMNKVKDLVSALFEARLNLSNIATYHTLFHLNWTTNVKHD